MGEDGTTNPSICDNGKICEEKYQSKESETDGIFSFYRQQDPSSTEMIVEPKKGRALLFTAGDENLHSVNKLVLEHDMYFRFGLRVIPIVLTFQEVPSQ